MTVTRSVKSKRRNFIILLHPSHFLFSLLFSLSLFSLLFTFYRMTSDAGLVGGGNSSNGQQRRPGEVTGKYLVDWCQKHMFEELGNQRGSSSDSIESTSSENNGKKKKKKKQGHRNERWKNESIPVINFLQRLMRARYLRPLSSSSSSSSSSSGGGGGGEASSEKVIFYDSEDVMYTFTLLAQQVRDAALNRTVLKAAVSATTNTKMINSNIFIAETTNPEALEEAALQIQQMQQMERQLLEQIRVMQQQQHVDKQQQQQQQEVTL